jgi:hypothetical protein
MAVYCAPAARPFRHLHIAEPGADFKAPAGAEPLTLCGLVMAYAELWVPMQRQPADRVCRDCSGEPGPARTAAVQQELALVR